MSDNVPAWFDTVIPTMRCSNCGRRFERTGVNVVGESGEHTFLRCLCQTCGTQQVGVVRERAPGAPPSEGLRWFDSVLESVRCAQCGTNYGREDVNIVGSRDEYWFLRCFCRNCGTQGIGVVIFKEVVVAASAPPVTAPQLSSEDVLDAHERLRDHRGGIEALFSDRKKRE